MSRVERDAEVTLVVLVYRSLRWLEWCMTSVDTLVTKARYRWLVVANDATEEVRHDSRIALDFCNDDPGEFYINRVYRAWNEGVAMAPTPLVCMLNSDMFASDHWLDELMLVKKRNPRTVPTSLLVESGRLPSAMPEHVRNFGMNPSEFDADAFRVHAETIRKRDALDAGRLYMPILVDRQEFIDVGGYPAGNPPEIGRASCRERLYL